MLTRIATFFANKLLANGLIEEDDTDVYVYGLEVLISTICSFLTVLLLGIILSEVITALIYLAVLIIIRRFTGGYHARTYVGCNLSCCIIFVISLYISKAVYFNLIPTIVIHSVGMVLIAVFSPVENLNKPLSPKKRKRGEETVSGIRALIIVGAVMFSVLGGITLLAYVYSLNNIKSKTVGDGQHGTARWMTKGEQRRVYRHIPFTPKKWRNQAKSGKTPTGEGGKPLPQGIVVGCIGNTTAMVDTSDVHVLMIGAAGVGKTAFWLYPCIEYACASGMSFLSTDTKGDVMRNYGNIAKDYGYNVSLIDLRNPTRSNGNNLLHLVNKYMDLYQANPEVLVNKAKAEKYAKIISKTIILSGMDAASFGQNAYFYDAAEGLLTATILLVAEFSKPEERHIVSVFKTIQELLAPSGKKGKNQFQQLMEMLPSDHKAKWFAGAALNTAEQSMASVMSTALSRLNTFLDSELEQLLCFDTEIDAEKFCSEKSAIFIIMPEENPNTFFMISLIIQQLYREILAVADENGGQLKNRCVFFCDEFGTLPKIESAEMMFSASRSRRLQIVPIIQSFAQLERNYGKEGAEIIVDNTQITLFGGFAPNSSSADTLSKALGSRTVMSGSVSRSKSDPSESLQMMERPLLTPDELKSLPKGEFIVMKTGVHPMRVRLKLFFKWGIVFDKDNPYSVAENGNRTVQYASKSELMDKIARKYMPEMFYEYDSESDGGGMSGPVQKETNTHKSSMKNQRRNR